MTMMFMRTLHPSGRRVSLAVAQQRLCSSSSSRVPDLLNATRTGHSILWAAPCAPTFKSHAARSAGSKIVFQEQIDALSFAGTAAPERATTVVVSAQTVGLPFLEAWREKYHSESVLTLVRRGTSLGSIDVPAAKELGIDVLNTPGVNSPHVARFVVETLGLHAPLAEPQAARVVVIGSGSVGRCVIEMIDHATGVSPIVVNRSTSSPSLSEALKGATHVAVCAATSSDPILTASHVRELLETTTPAQIQICSVSRPEAFSLEAIMLVAEQGERVQLRFDYGQSVLAPTREQVNNGGVKDNITWSSVAMASDACKADMDEAVLRILVERSRSMQA